MLATIIAFFKPPESDDFEETQKLKFLHVTLLVISGACILLGFLNEGVNTYLGIALFGFSGLNLFGVYLNKRGYFRFTAFAVSVLLLAIITFSLIDGVGLRDAGMVAFPIYIIYTTFLFNKKIAIPTAITSMGAAAFVYYLGQIGMLTPAKYSDEANLKVLLVLLLATGGFLWAVMNSWEKILQNLRDTYDLTLSGWAKALEYRDQETEGHSQRVIELTLELAQHIGLSKKELHHIRRGALLHDIGKMAVPDSILLKNGSLTDDEWKVMKKHPAKARELLKDIPFLKPALDIPYYHHERWDGSGYPIGLSQDDIPLSARIFAVIDVWDALNSDRPYRKAWPEEKVKAYLQEEAGKTLDPKIVQSFLELVA